MLKVDTLRTENGMILALPVYHPSEPTRILLRQNYELKTSVIKRMRDVGIRYIYVKYPPLEFLDTVMPSFITETNAMILNHVKYAFAASQEHTVAHLPFDRYEETLKSLVYYITQNPEAATFIEDCYTPINQEHDLMRHASQVSYLSILMGMKLEGYIVKQRKHVKPGEAANMINLGMGAMLHDIGIKLLPEKVKNDYFDSGQDTPDWREHTSLGYEAIRGKIQPSAATILLNHHQRHDGSGFSGKNNPVLAENQIHIFPRIVALADYFDRYSHPINQPPISSIQTIKHILDPDILKQFDPQVVRALLSIIPPYPIGSRISLSDGRHAVVINHNINNPCRPVIQIAPAPDQKISDDDEPGDTLELSECNLELQVITCDGANVEDHFFKAPEILKDITNTHIWS